MSFDRDGGAESFARPLPAAAVRRKRPAPVAASAAVLAAFAGVGLLSLAGLLVAGGADAPTAPPIPGPLRALFDHIVPVSIARASIDALALAAAYAIWSGRRWGRAAGIAVSACWAIASVAFGIAFSLSLPEGMAASLPAAFVGMWRGAAVTTGLFWGAVLSTPWVVLTRRSAAAWFDATS